MNYLMKAVQFLFVVAVAGTSFNVHAASTGTIQGVVKDVGTGDPLPGANVYLEGTSLGAAANLDGKYLISRVPPGNYTLVVRYIGFKTREVPVAVLVDEKSKLDLELDYEVVESGEDVVVTAQAEGQMQAINQQLTSKSIVNVVSAARIQELPDANAAESVGRLPGVSVLRSGGEGNKVVIRGLSPKYNNITINGVKMAATGSGDRSADLSMISPYMLEGIEVSKAATPDHDADVIGGTVNFKIRQAKEGLKYDFLTQGGHNGLRSKTGDYKFVAGASNRFLSNNLGIFAQIDIEKRNRSSHELGAKYRIDTLKDGQENEVLLESFNLRDISRNRQRYGGSLVMDLKIPDGSLKYTAFGSIVDNKDLRRGNVYNLRGGTNANSHDYTLGDNENRLTILTNTLHLNQDFSLFRLNASASRSFSKNRTPKNISFTFTERAAFRDSAFIASIDSTPPTKYPSFAKNDIDNTNLSRIVTSFNENRETQYTVSSDLEFDLNFTSQVTALVKFGGKVRFSNRSFNHDETFMPIDWGGRQDMRNAVLNAFPEMQEQTPIGSSTLSYSSFIDQSYRVDNFLDGNYQMGPSAQLALIRAVNNVTEPLAWQHAKNNLTSDYSGNEEYRAGYIMSEINLGKWIQFIPGVRYERNKTEYTGVRGDATQNSSTHLSYAHIDTTTIRTNSFLLPMFHLRYKPLDWFDVRLAYTNTLARPSYNQIIPAWNIGVSSNSWKNFNLRPSRSKNFDFYLSAYNNIVGLFTFGAFRKEIDDLIFSTGSRAILDPSEYGFPATEKGKKVTTTINNNFQVSVWGIEYDWQTHFWYLPGVLRGLVFNANYTAIFSRARYPKTSIIVQQFPFQQTNIDTFYTDRLINQPNHVINWALGYDYKGFSGRLSMLFQSNIFKDSNFAPELRGRTDDHLRFDISLKQNLPYKGAQIYLNLNNITGAIDRNLNAGTLFPTVEQHYGATIDVGLRIKG